MPLDLTSLALDAGTAPQSDALVDSRPHDLAVDEILGGTDAAVLAVGVEDMASEEGEMYGRGYPKGMSQRRSSSESGTQIFFSWSEV